MGEGHRREEPARGIGRRGLLARLGATGLAAAVSVFADGGTARASAGAIPGTTSGAIPGTTSGAMCCDLHNFPANSSYEYCHEHAGYIWYCSLSEYLHCSCCETDGQKFSAAECTTNQDLA